MYLSKNEIEKVISHRIELFNVYREGLKGVVDMPLWNEKSNFNGAYMPIRFKNSKQRELIESNLGKNAILSRQYFAPSLDTIFDSSRTFSNINSQYLSKRVLCLPLHYYMDVEDVVNIIDIIRESLRSVK